MEAPPLLPGRRGPPGAAEPGEPPRKRVCKLLETLPNEADARLIDCAMELDSKQKLSSGCGPWDAKTKPNSMVFENQGSRGTAQPCPRCIAGESAGATATIWHKEHAVTVHQEHKELSPRDDGTLQSYPGLLEIERLQLSNTFYMLKTPL